jgi:hypothetical protein
VFCGGLWLGLSVASYPNPNHGGRGTKEPSSLTEGQVPDWDGEGQSGEGDVRMGTVRNLGLGIEGRPNSCVSGHAGASVSRRGSSLSWRGRKGKRKGQGQGIEGSKVTPGESPLVQIEDAAVVAPREECEEGDPAHERLAMTTLALLHLFHREGARWVGGVGRLVDSQPTASPPSMDPSTSDPAQLGTAPSSPASTSPTERTPSAIQTPMPPSPSDLILTPRVILSLSLNPLSNPDLRFLEGLVRVYGDGRGSVIRRGLSDWVRLFVG